MTVNDYIQLASGSGAARAHSTASENREEVTTARTVTRSASRVQGAVPKVDVNNESVDHNDSVFDASGSGGRVRARQAPVNRLHQRLMANETLLEPVSETEGTSTRRVTRSQSLRQARPAAVSGAHDCSMAGGRRRRADESTAAIHELETSTNNRSKKVKK